MTNREWVNSLSNEQLRQSEDLQKMFNAQNFFGGIGGVASSSAGHARAEINGINSRNDQAIRQYNKAVEAGDTAVLNIERFSNGKSAIGFALNAAGSILGYEQAAFNLTNSVSQGVSSNAQSMANTAAAYQAQKLNDELAYGIEQNVVLPTVMFPYNTETLRDFYGNGVLVYRFWYTQDDIARIRKIIRAYGVKYSMKTDISHFAIETGGQFAYVEATGVSVANLPQWLANGVAAQLANGVRIWNTRPTTIA